MDLGLKDKVIVVMGGTSGIGLATARQFAMEGGKVAICGVDQPGVDAALSQLSDLCCDTYGQMLNATHRNEVDEFAENVFQKYGKIDVWINCIGAPSHKTDGTFTNEDIDFAVNLNFKTTFYGCSSAYRFMKQNTDGGAIINISSMAARYPTAGDKSLYGPMKAAVESLTVTLGTEYAASNIRVVAIAPGGTITPMIASFINSPDFQTSMSSANVLGCLAEPEDIANVIVFAASGRARHITCTSIDVSGGTGVITNPDYSRNDLG